MEDELWGMPTGVSHLVPVAGVFYAEREEDTIPSADDNLARLDDAYWSSQVRATPFTWQAFTDWWIARRWIIPRDITKE